MTKTDTERPKTRPDDALPDAVKLAIRAAFSKKASDVTLLDLRKGAAFTDRFVICSGQHARHVKAIADAIEEALRKDRVKPVHVEGYAKAEWVLIDVFDFVVHVFTPDTREFYALERLWGNAQRLAVSEDDVA